MPHYMLAGSASTNPVLFTIALFLILGWKVSGYIGVDHWLLPLTRGIPWNMQSIFGSEARQETLTASVTPEPTLTPEEMRGRGF